MATVSVEGVSIKGISCCVPATIERNIDIKNYSSEDIKKLINLTGVEERRVASDDVCTSDLCLKAANDLIDSLKWERDSIDILVFVSQTADYILPVTSAILQDRLNLSENCIAFDVPLGCSGYVYGISVITGMMKAFGLNRGILLAGDTSSKLVSKFDKSTFPLFGDAGSASAFEADGANSKIYFDLGTDGSGYQSIIIPAGGSRNKVSSESFNYVDYSSGIVRNQCELVLNGMDVFSFGISVAPKSVNNLLETYSIDKEDIDYFIFHQANMMMNQKIVKKLKLPQKKVLYSLGKFGNTSSATIPLTIVLNLKNELFNTNKEVIICGFGVGLSWGTAKMSINNLIVNNITEI
jgi:3-oxoacyl-[acyl-carrier-protein] synthase III